MYRELLDTIRAEATSAGESLQIPCSAESLNKLRIRARQTLGHDIPNEYAEFLMTANGLDWNGLAVYASERIPITGYSDRFIEGFVEGNLDYREFKPMKDFLIFADDGDVLYTYCIPKGRFQIITNVGLSVLESFPTFDELVANALEGHS